MTVVALSPATAAAQEAWAIYANATQALVKVERDICSTSQMRASAALVAHQAWRVFQAAYERIAA